MLKRYLLFAGYSYYPSGGWGDFQGSFDTFDEARSEAREIESHWDWSHIVDTDTGEIY